MSVRSPIDSPSRANGVVLPPGGATFASFVLFASLAALLGIAYMGSEWVSLGGGFGFPTDAGWVRAVFARSLATGHGFSFNPGIAVAGAAAPAWLTVLGVAALPTGEYVVTAKMLGVLSTFLAACFVWGLARRLLDDWRFAFLAGLLVIVSPLLTSQALGGTEGSFAAMLVAAAVYWQGVGWTADRWTRVLGAITLGLAALARPELFLLLPLALVDRWVVAGVHGQSGRRLGPGLGRSFPEVLGAAAVLAPYLIYNRLTGGAGWQQPELSLRAQPPLAWAKAGLMALWANDPVLLVAAAVGLVVVVLAAGRARTNHPTFLPALTPLALLLVPGLLGKHASPSNAAYTAASLVPLIALLGAAGLFLVYRLAQGLLLRVRNRATRFVFAFGVGIALIAVFGTIGAAHSLAWQEHGKQVKKVGNLQAAAGRWASRHLASDASIACREVGAIGFFSQRRVIDLGGTLSTEGLSALQQPGSPDANLLAYLQKVQPSHLALRPGDFPDVARRADLLTPAVTCADTDRETGGVTTLVLYETIWPSPSVRASQGERHHRRSR